MSNTKELLLETRNEMLRVREESQRLIAEGQRLRNVAYNLDDEAIRLFKQFLTEEGLTSLVENPVDL